MERIDLASWDRRQLFKIYEEALLPYIILSARVDVTRLLTYVRRKGFSFSAALTFACTHVANGIENFHYRFDEAGPYRIRRNAATMTHMRKGDERFVIVEGPETEDIAAHCRAVAALLDDPAYDYGLENLAEREDIINFSSMPWVDYTHFFRPIYKAGGDCVPKIAWGKYTTDATGCTALTLTVQVHHGLMDGYHVGLFYERLQEYLDSL